MNGLIETSPSSACPRVASTGRLDRARQKTNFCLMVVFSFLRIDRSSTSGIRNKPRLVPVANLSGQLAQKLIGFLGGPNPRQLDDMIASFFRALRECDSLPLLPQDKIHFTSSLYLRTILPLSLVFRTRSVQLGSSSKHWTIPTSYTSPARPPYIPQKFKKTFFPKNNSKISKINSRINFIQKYPRNYCSISSQIVYNFLLCFFVRMCFAKLHFLTVHLQTSHSISI